jgi:N-methylhydantoinase A
MLRQGFRLAIDIGGTFTDLECVDLATGQAASFKTPTTPDDFSIGFMGAVRGAAVRFGFGIDEIRLIMHGTTIATNAVLTRRLPQGALITTAGFEDVLEIGRHVRKDVYGLKPEARAVLAARRHRFGVEERMGARGEIVRPLDMASLDRAIDRLGESGAEVVAVALINAYLNPAHEVAIHDRIAARLPGLRIACSHAVSPEIREFERSATTMLNALLMPVVQGYIDRLLARLGEAGIRAPLYLVQSNGGVATPEAAGAAPVKLLLSGPAGGVLAAETLAQRLGIGNVVGVDMGGTSYDVALIQDGRRAVVAQGEIDGLPVRVPMVEMRTIGAGGGSIAAVAGGRLRVGPESAGAKPGPVCYRRGGTEPTTTDANLVLGLLSPQGFMRGGFPLDLAGARDAIRSRVAEPLGITTEHAAAGIVQVVNAGLAGAIKLSLFERGLDPRDFALMSFGGAGGLHATAVAEELGIGRVIFPKDPSTFSAHGILQSDIVHDLARTRITPLVAGAAAALAPLVEALANEGRQLLAGDDLPDAAMELKFSADLRYRGQAFELMLPLDAALTDAGLAALAGRFHAAHLARFSFDDRSETVELVTLRLTAIGRLGAPKQAALAGGRASPDMQARMVHHQGRSQPFLVVQQADLAAGSRLAGPAIVEQEYTSLLIGPGWRLTMTEAGDMLAEQALP